jgi:hypothetical protein
MPSKEASESQKYVRTADTRKLRDNATVRRLACSVAWELSFSVFCRLRCSCIAVSSIRTAPFSSTCSTQSDNNSRKWRLHFGCQFPWCALALGQHSSSLPTGFRTKNHYTLLRSHSFLYACLYECVCLRFLPSWLSREMLFHNVLLTYSGFILN